MPGIVRFIFSRMLAFMLTRFIPFVGRTLAFSGLFLLAVLAGIYGGLWSQSDRLTQAGLILTGMSLLDGNQKGPFYWIARVVLFAIMLAFWVISCFAVVWFSRTAFGFKF